MFLQYNNALNEELAEAVSSLMSEMSSSTAPNANREPSRIDRRVEPPGPFRYRVKSTYIGADIWNPIAEQGDMMEAYGWHAGNATAYNLLKDKIGWIPGSHLKYDRKSSRNATKQEIVYSSGYHRATNVGDITWEAGDHIRICKYSDGNGTAGTGYNITTGSFGRFTVRPGTFWKA